MPPRHATPQMLPALRAAAPLRCGLITFCLLTAPGVARVHAQSMPPAVTAPTDPFHQPCVAIHATPDAHGKPRIFTLPGVVAPTAANAIARKQYIDLDDRCATPPAFAPTRDTDSTNVWYVGAPADDGHTTTSRRTDTSAVHGLMS